jgi:hypothetical protein
VSNESSFNGVAAGDIVSNSYLPYKSSSKDYSLGLVDRDIVKRYRLWMLEYFRNEFQYDRTSTFTLSKVREAISGAMILGKSGNSSADFEQQLKLREFDLLVRVDEMKPVAPSPAKHNRFEDSKIGESPIVQAYVQLKISD